MAKRRTSISSLRPASDDAWVAAAKAAGPRVHQVLDFLVKKGCDRSFLIACLRVLAWADLPRLTQKHVEHATQEFRSAARWLRDLEGSDLGYKIRDAVPGGLSDLHSGLDALIRAVEQNVSLADRRGARTHSDCVAALVRHVQHTVGQYRDAEVSSLVEAAPEIEARLWRDAKDAAKPGRTAVGASRSARGPYGEQAHAKWRKRHREILDEETVFEREWRLKAQVDRWEALRALLYKRPMPAFEVTVFEHAAGATKTVLKET